MNASKKPRSYSVQEQIKTLDRIFLEEVENANRLDVDEPKLKWEATVFSNDGEISVKSSTDVSSDTKALTNPPEEYLPLPHYICHRHKAMVTLSDKPARKTLRLKNIFRHISTLFR